ncbi:hypothetical protein [Motiliproteus sp. MSK22-1]|nr:hypothetical protein [Motiliproteus sp. MSK22-1]
MTILVITEQAAVRQWFERVIELIRWLLRYLRDLVEPTVFL